jgi:hypothetical protein
LFFALSILAIALSLAVPNKYWKQNDDSKERPNKETDVQLGFQWEDKEVDF